MEEEAVYTAVVYDKKRQLARAQARSEAAQYFNTIPDKIQIFSESAEKISTHRDWNYQVTCLCAIDYRPVGIKI
jgi:hypothetical protein